LEKTVRSPTEWQREIDVTIEPDKLEAKLAELYDEYRQKAVVPGFRPGKAPRYVLERRIGGQLQTAAAENLVEQAIREVLADETSRPITEPKFNNLEVAPDRSVRFQLSFEVIPDFPLQEYVGLSLKKQEPTGFDAEFERRLRELRESCATFRPVDRPAQMRDFVVVDRRMYVGEAEAEKPRLNLMLELGDALNTAEVNHALLGAKPGEERVATLTIPADHSDQKLAGKSVTYKFAVRDVKERTLPEVDEELAADLGYASLDSLRLEINDQIVADRERQMKSGLKNQVFDFLIANHQFVPPRSWVESSLERLRAQYNLPKDPGTRDRLLPLAEKWAKFDCIVARIAAREGITVTEGEIRQQAQEVAAESKRPVEEVESILDTATYKNQLLREKVLKFVVDKANVT